MAIHKLTARDIRALADGFYGDGGGLYLKISGKSRSWVFRYRIDGRERYMGLGALDTVTLAMARDKALAARRVLADGSDPLAQRQITKSQEQTFADAVAVYLQDHADEIGSERQVEAWRSTLTTYALPVLGKLRMRDITTALILRVLRPIWKTKTMTASYVRGRIEAVWAQAAVSGFCSGPNPALWENNLDKLLPAPRKLKPIAHLRALPFVDLPNIMRGLCALDSLGAHALRFTMLTAVRSSSTRRANWRDIDLDNAVWQIGKTKNGDPIDVPLSAPAVTVLRALRQQCPDSALVFPSLGRTAMLKTLQGALGYPGISAHALTRAGFKGWASNRTAFPEQVIEAALSHRAADDVQAAYNRDLYFEKRKALMDAWGEFLTTAPAGAGENVIALRS